MTVSVKTPPRSPRRPVEMGLAQFDLVRGIRWARVNSARKRSPACNWCGSIMARPSRPRRLASHAKRLSTSLTLTRLWPCSVSICRVASSRCWPRNRSFAGSGWSGSLTGLRDFPCMGWLSDSTWDFLPRTPQTPLQGIYSGRGGKLCVAAIWRGGGAAGPTPFAWRAASARRHNSAPPSGSRGPGSICRGIARASYCIGCAGVA